MTEAELRWLYPVKIAAVVVVLWSYRRHYPELVWRRLDARMWGWAIGTGVVVLVLWLNLDADWMEIGRSSGYDPRTDGRINWPLVVVRISGAALVVPVMEELFWRSFLMRWLDNQAFLTVDPARVGLRALLVTTVLFGIEHSLWLAGMVAGAVYGLLYMRSKNLWVPIIAHGVTNGLLGAWIVSTSSWTYW